MKIKIIGDVHGKFHAYLERIKDVEYSIQLGDFGFAKEWNSLVKHKVDYERHKIIPGNHDEYPYLNKNYTFGKEYGEVDFNGFKFFFVRGAWSIDWSYRTPGVSWWKEEQLPYSILMDAITDYEKVKPNIMITHDLSKEGMENIYNKPFVSDGTGNRTSIALDQMFRIHRPKIWFYGHWHQTRIDNLLGTKFVCLDELDSIDYEIGENVDYNIEKITQQIKNINNRRKPLKW